MKKLISVVVPCYNDGSTITSVIVALKKSDLVSEIIVVDDGSKIETKKILSQIKGIELITNHRNIGKSRTLKVGVHAAKSDYLALVDSDLLNFTTEYFQKLALPVVQNRCDITLSYRGQEAWYGIISGFAIAYTGERVMPRSLIMEHLDIFDHNRYVIEGAFNQVFFPKYRVRGVYLPQLAQVGQPQKKGLVGCLINFRQIIDYIKISGLLGFFYQLYYVKKPGFLIQP